MIYIFLGSEQSNECKNKIMCHVQLGKSLKYYKLKTISCYIYDNKLSARKLLILRNLV